MAEYIKRALALSAYKETEIDAIISKKSWPETWRELIRNLEAIPAADVVEVVHGRWIFKRGWYEADECNCSQCGQLLTTPAKERAKYCPNCGARMDGTDVKDT